MRVWVAATALSLIKSNFSPPPAQMTTKTEASSLEHYLEVSITYAPRGLNVPPVNEPIKVIPSLGEVSKALHEVADQVLEGAPIGHIAIGDRFVANWQFGRTLDDLDLAEVRQARLSKAESSPAPGNDVGRDTQPVDNFEEPEITHVGDFCIPVPQPVARASTYKNARPIYRYFPFKPGKSVGDGSWQAAARALKVFAVLHAAHHGNEGIEFEDLQPLFFRSSSDLITYREGWKAGRFWSVEAFKVAVSAPERHTNGLISEHVMPRSQTLMRALKIEDVGLAAEFVWNNSFECVVTAKENDELTRRDAKRPKRDIWVFENGPWERYKGTGICILDVECNGHKWLTQQDRDVLSKLDLLANWDPSFLNQAAPAILDEWRKYAPVTKK